MKTNIVHRKKKRPPSSLAFSLNGTLEGNGSLAFLATLASLCCVRSREDL
jgi:hypothetical protein